MTEGVGTGYGVEIADAGLLASRCGIDTGSGCGGIETGRGLARVPASFPLGPVPGSERGTSDASLLVSGPSSASEDRSEAESGLELARVRPRSMSGTGWVGSVPVVRACSHTRSGPLLAGLAPEGDLVTP
jgi:hypothetical protein